MRQHDHQFGLERLALLQDEGGTTFDTYIWLVHSRYRRGTQRGKDVAPICTTG